MYIEPKYGDEKMEVLLGNEPFARLIEEYMGPDARRYFEEMLKDCKAVEYSNGYENGYKDGVNAMPAGDEVMWADVETP